MKQFYQNVRACHKKWARARVIARDAVERDLSPADLFDNQSYQAARTAVKKHDFSTRFVARLGGLVRAYLDEGSALYRDVIYFEADAAKTPRNREWYRGEIEHKVQLKVRSRKFAEEHGRPTSEHDDYIREGLEAYLSITPYENCTPRIQEYIGTFLPERVET
ncbi:MAG: hypothetical protein OXR66_06755 [Candidatus Woesearchaeota archaeon]|nr:hypothetical protein [Candidatus Woesearchaeota archaeon]